MINDAYLTPPLFSHFYHYTNTTLLHLRWTRVGPLSSSCIDLSVNAYGHTGHLLCHDDVIGSRRVSIPCLVLFVEDGIINYLVLMGRPIHLSSVSEYAMSSTTTTIP